VSRLGIAGSALGLARRSLELATAYSQQRITFGKPIAKRQAVKMLLAEMAADIFAVQSAVMETCRKYDRGESITNEAAMCKLLAIEMVGSVTDRALRLHGGIGYTGAHKIERHYRDARALWFEEGTAEIQKLVVGGAVVRGELVL
jgi:alkylation response protein AidB-like acyl-CoA dehydrogenase